MCFSVSKSPQNFWAEKIAWNPVASLAVMVFFRPDLQNYPLIQNDYRQEKIIFELFSGALQENPARAPGAITGGALTGQGPIQQTTFGELFSGAIQENPVIAPGQLPPGTKPIHAGKISWGINFCANTCGACIRTRANTGKYF